MQEHYPDKMKEILITGWYGTETLGDKAILAGLVSAIKKKINKPKIYIQSENEHISKITNSQLGVLNDLSIVNENQAFHLCDKVDYLIFGGGPIMAIFPLAKIESYFLKASKSKTRTIVAGCGIGPLGSSALNDSILRILTSADNVILRDENSYKLAKSIGYKGEAKISECPSFIWLRNENEQSIFFKDFDSINKKKVLLGLRNPPMIQYGKKIKNELRKNLENNFMLKMRNILTKILKELGDVTIVPIPMCTNSYGDDDRWFYRKLFNEIKNEQIDYKYLSQEFSPSEYFKEFKSSDISICMRYHSIVFSVSAGIKTICIDYTLGEGKVASIADKFNLPLVDLTNIDEDSFVDLFINSYNNQKTSHRIGNTFMSYFHEALNE